MLLAALRDLEWRKRRFAITVVGTALVLAMTLVLSGLAATFDREAEDTIDVMAADLWVGREDATGPFFGASLLDAASVEQVGDLPGVERADPMLFVGMSEGDPADLKPVNLFGVVPDGAGSPVVTDGRGLEADGEAVVSTLLGADVGEEIVLDQQPFEVVGTIGKSTVLAGTPNVFVTVDDIRDLAFAGHPVVTTMAVDGAVEETPADLKLFDHDDAVADFLAPVEAASGAITFLSVLLWIVAAIIIGSVMYLSVLERIRDFAVFKAVGASNGSLMASLALQAVILTLISAAIATLLALVLAPLFPLPVVIPPATLLLLPFVAVGIGLVASLTGLRRAASVDPAAAFGGP